MIVSSYLYVDYEEKSVFLNLFINFLTDSSDFYIENVSQNYFLKLLYDFYTKISFHIIFLKTD